MAQCTRNMYFFNNLKFIRVASLRKGSLGLFGFKWSILYDAVESIIHLVVS